MATKKKAKHYYWCFPSRPKPGQPYVEKLTTGTYGCFNGRGQKVRETNDYTAAIEWWALADASVRP